MEESRRAVTAPAGFVDWRQLTLDDWAGVGPGPQGLVGTSMVTGEHLLPVMALRESALQHNVELMASWCRAVGVQLAPHAKTTMSREIVGRQMAAGAWGVTAATVTQVRTLLGYGVRRLILANITVHPAAIAWLASLAEQVPDLAIHVFADSLASVQILDRSVSQGSLAVLVELGVPGYRTGARDSPTALDVARAVSRSRHLELAGVSAYEGVVPADRETSTLELVGQVCDRSADTFQEILSSGLFDVDEPVLSVGGSAYLDVVTSRVPARAPDATVVLRSGCYVTHDHGLYEALSHPLPDGGLRPALELWGQVVSMPEPDLFVVNVGRRECPDDAGGPRVLRVWRGSERLEPGAASWVKIYDHHTVFRTSGAAVRVGDVVVLGISHPCSAFSRWRTLPLIDDADTVIGFAHSYV